MSDFGDDLRDHFAGLAMQALVSSRSVTEASFAAYGEYARRSYIMADAMLSERLTKQPADLEAARTRQDAISDLNAAHNAITLALEHAIRDGDGVGATKALAAMKKAAADLFEVVA